MDCAGCPVRSGTVSATTSISPVAIAAYDDAHPSISHSVAPVARRDSNASSHVSGT